VCIYRGDNSQSVASDRADHKIQTKKTVLAEVVNPAKALVSSGFLRSPDFMEGKNRRLRLYQRR
jgi:hypothetical protein